MYRYIESFDKVVNDYLKFLSVAKINDKELFGKPLFFTGLSMGGAEAIYLALKEPSLAKGLILFSPGLMSGVICI